MKIKRSSIINEYDSVCPYCIEPGQGMCCGECHFEPGIGVEEEWRGIKYEQIYPREEIDEIIEDESGTENNVLTIKK